MPDDAVGFWSYARDDDTAEGGRIVRLSRQLRAEFQLLTGETLGVFVDREGLEWGDQWRARIDEALAGTTFFIPVITPRFFMSRECRRELLTFSGIARSVGLEELILPIYYVAVPDIEAGQPSTDEAISLVADRHRQDWRDLRLEDESSARHRQGVNALAQQLAGIAARVRERPDIQAGERENGRRTSKEADDEDESEGFVDLLAKGEEALPKLGPIIEDAGGIVETVGKLAEEATERVTRSDAQGRGFAGRLTVSRELAKKLEQPADALASFGEEFLSVVADIDPAILTIIRIVDADPSQWVESQEVRQLFNGIKEMAVAARDAVRNTEGFISNLDEWAKLSRDLRKPVRRMQAGLRGYVDASQVFNEWERLIDNVEAKVDKDALSP